MPLNRVPGKPFGALVDHVDGRGGRSCVCPHREAPANRPRRVRSVFVLILLGSLLALVPLAHPSPPVEVGLGWDNPDTENHEGTTPLDAAHHAWGGHTRGKLRLLGSIGSHQELTLNQNPVLWDRTTRAPPTRSFQIYPPALIPLLLLTVVVISVSARLTQHAPVPPGVRAPTSYMGPPGVRLCTASLDSFSTPMLVTQIGSPDSFSTPSFRHADQRGAFASSKGPPSGSRRT